MVVRLDVLRIGGETVCATGSDERRLVHAVSDTLTPDVERLAHSREVLLDVVEDTEVRQREAHGRATLGLPERLVPGFEVDVGRRSRGEHEVRGRDRTPTESPA